MLGMRLGLRPRVVITTTPQPIPLIRRIERLKGSVGTGGRTVDNIHLPAEFIAAVTAAYGGTRLGRQELDGVYLEEREGALWTRALIERCRSSPLRRGSAASDDERDSFARVVIGVDPPAGVNGICGIVVAGLGRDGMAYVLADASAERVGPERWAEAVARAAEQWRADRVIAEANQGGAMVESVLRAVQQTLPIRLRHASEAKGKRAEPVAALFEAGRACFAGSFPELEDQLVALMPGGGYAAPGSPDRADAMVWAMAELMLGRRHEPRIRAF
jgi:phage terminase large subunit-like protein